MFAEWQEIYSVELMQLSNILGHALLLIGIEVYAHKNLVSLTALLFFGLSAEGDSQLALTMP